jgi:transcriptional regulator with XRE-family HTH domain
MVDATSTAGDIGQRIADRVRDLRNGQGLSLEALAARTGVSRSMLSLIERGESSPTAVVLEKLATGLGVMLASLFDTPGPVRTAADPVSRRREQPEWRDPGSGYVRRNVSPDAVPQPFQIVEVRFPAGARVAFDTGARDTRVHQQIWILDGVMEVTVGAGRHRLREGDCLAMQLDRPTMFHNPSRRTARYAVVVAQEPRTKR